MPDPIEITPGSRVRIRTATGGCYHGAVGTVAELLDMQFRPLREKDYGYAHWYKVLLDQPADNGGKPVLAEIFLGPELRLEIKAKTLTRAGKEAPPDG